MTNNSVDFYIQKIQEKEKKNHQESMKGVQITFDLQHRAYDQNLS